MKVFAALSLILLTSSCVNQPARELAQQPAAPPPSPTLENAVQQVCAEHGDGVSAAELQRQLNQVMKSRKGRKLLEDYFATLNKTAREVAAASTKHDEDLLRALDDLKTFGLPKPGRETLVAINVLHYLHIADSDAPLAATEARWKKTVEQELTGLPSVKRLKDWTAVEADADIAPFFLKFLSAHGYGTPELALPAYTKEIKQRLAALKVFIKPEVFARIAILARGERLLADNQPYMLTTDTADRLVSVDYLSDLILRALTRKKSAFSRPLSAANNLTDELAMRSQLASQIGSAQSVLTGPKLEDTDGLGGIGTVIRDRSAHSDEDPFAGVNAGIVSYVANQLLLPKDKTARDQLSGWVEWSRQRAAVTAEKVFAGDPDTLSAVKKTIAEIHFQLPLTADELRQNVMSAITAANQPEMKEGGDARSLALVELLSAQNSTEPFYDLAATLNFMPPLSLLTDRAYSAQGNIFLSSALFGHEASAKFVTMHEIAHVVSNSVQRREGSAGQKKYAAVRACLNQRHVAGGDQFTEEDWADWFAGAGSEGTVNGACVLREDPGTPIYLNSTHSDYLFRILRAEVMAGRANQVRCEDDPVWLKLKETRCD